MSMFHLGDKRMVVSDIGEPNVDVVLLMRRHYQKQNLQVLILHKEESL